MVIFVHLANKKGFFSWSNTHGFPAILTINDMVSMSSLSAITSVRLGCSDTAESGYFPIIINPWGHFAPIDSKNDHMFQFNRLQAACPFPLHPLGLCPGNLFWFSAQCSDCTKHVGSESCAKHWDCVVWMCMAFHSWYIYLFLCVYIYIYTHNVKCYTIWHLCM